MGGSSPDDNCPRGQLTISSHFKSVSDEIKCKVRTTQLFDRGLRGMYSSIHPVLSPGQKILTSMARPPLTNNSNCNFSKNAKILKIGGHIFHYNKEVLVGILQNE